MNDNIKAIIETTLKAEIVKALNSAPDAIEKLVTAAISQPVDSHTGSTGGYGSKVPYLDFLVGDEIRRAARDAVHEVFAAKADLVKEAVKRKFSADDMVEAFAKAVINASAQDWKITVKFEGDRDS